MPIVRTSNEQSYLCTRALKTVIVIYPTYSPTSSVGLQFKQSQLHPCLFRPSRIQKRYFEFGKTTNDSQVYGGETGIRTLETVSRLHTFQACAFDHSATSP